MGEKYVERERDDGHSANISFKSRILARRVAAPLTLCMLPMEWGEREKQKEGGGGEEVEGGGWGHGGQRR